MTAGLGMERRLALEPHEPVVKAWPALRAPRSNAPRSDELGERRFAAFDRLEIVLALEIPTRVRDQPLHRELEAVKQRESVEGVLVRVALDLEDTRPVVQKPFAVTRRRGFPGTPAEGLGELTTDRTPSLVAGDEALLGPVLVDADGHVFDEPQDRAVAANERQKRRNGLVGLAADQESPKLRRTPPSTPHSKRMTTSGPSTRQASPPL